MSNLFISTSSAPNFILKNNSASSFQKGIVKTRITTFDSPLEECPNPKTQSSVNPLTGEIIYQIRYRWEESLNDFVPVRCGNNSCRPCAHLNAKRIAGAIYVSQPSHTFTLTLVPDNSKAIGKQVQKIFEHARKEIPTLAYVWSAESNPGNTGAHVHGYVHAEKNYFSSIGTTLTNSISKVTLGNRSEVKPIPQDAGISYFDYPMKSVLDPDVFEAYLDLNSSQNRKMLIHSSQKPFWRDGVDGPTYKKRKKLEVIAKRKRQLNYRTR